MQDEVADVMRIVESGDDIQEKDLVVEYGRYGTSRVKRSRRVTATARAVSAVKAQYPHIEKRTPADNMMIEKFVRDYLKNRGTGVIEICEIAPIAAEMFWIPTKYDIRAKEAAATIAATSRTTEYGRWYWSLPSFLGGGAKFD